MASKGVVQVPVRPKSWSRREYEALGRLGVLEPDSRVELIEGEIVELTPQGSKHAATVMMAYDALNARVPSGYSLRVQLPLALRERSEVEPDICLVKGSHRDYLERHPETARVIVEVSESTLDYDRDKKGSLYAKAGIPEYWIVNLNDYRLEIYGDPGALGEQTSANFGYRSSRVLLKGDRLAVPEADTTVLIDEILP